MEKTKKQNTLVDELSRDAKTMPLAKDKFVESIEWYGCVGSKAYLWHAALRHVKKHERAQMESSDVDSVRDRSTGETKRRISKRTA